MGFRWSSFSQMRQARAPVGVLSAVAFSALILVGCRLAPGVAPLRLVTTPVASTTATLKLDLTGWRRFAPRRLLVYAEPAAKFRVRIFDTRGVARRDAVMAFTSAPVTLADLPVLTRAVIEVQTLDDADRPIPGDVLRAPISLKAGANACELSPASSVGGAAMQALISADVTLGTSVAETIDFDGVASAVVNWSRELGAPSPGLLDPLAIALAWRTGGPAPVATSAFFPPPATVRVVPENWPPGLEAFVELSDPLSEPVFFDGLPLDFGPVASGAWNLRVVPLDDALPPLEFPVTLSAGQTIVRPVGFGSPLTQTPLTVPRGNAAFGVRTTPGASDTLVIAGGLTQTPTGMTVQGSRAASSVIAIGGASFSAVLPHAFHSAASVTHEGYLYWLGGRSSTRWSALMGRMNLATGEVNDEFAVIPDRSDMAPSGIYALAAAALNGVIYVAGGIRSAESTAQVEGYVVAENRWLPVGELPDLPEPRYGMASAVVGNTWYLCGGNIADGGVAPVSDDVLAWSPGSVTGFRTVSEMPTPRTAASAVAWNGKIWIVGGQDDRGRLSAAVEVYDPVANTWTRRPPLRKPRAHAAVGVLDGQLVVAGGLLGSHADGLAPLADVEVISPTLAPPAIFRLRAGGAP